MKSHIALTLGLLCLTACSPPPSSPGSFKSKSSGDAKGETTGTVGEELGSGTDLPKDDGTVDSGNTGGNGTDNPPIDDTAGDPPPTEDPMEDPIENEPEPPQVSAPLSADLMARASQSTKVNNTKMGRWFQTAVNKRATSSEMKFLEDPNQNVPIPSNKSDWVYKRFNVKLYPSGGLPHPADGFQTAIGDCNMLAMFNSFAYQHPEFLKGLIKDKGNGTFEIKMFNPQGERITVGVNSDFLSDRKGNLVAVRGVNNSAVWITVMEKAIMKYNQVFKIWNGDGPAKVEGFGSEAGAPMLTGEGDSYAFGRGALKSKEDLTRVVKEALAAGKLITGGFGVPMTMNGLKSVTGHAYTVMVPANNRVMISMRNPWGTTPKADGGSDTSHDGILDITYDENWFKTIDLRVMEPGIAGVTGQTGPYQPRYSIADAGFSADDLAFQLEMHAKYGQ